MIGIAANLSILAFFKYAGLLSRTFLSIDPQQGGGVGHFIAMIPLPVGISFFTFQGMSLVADTFGSRNLPQLQQIVHRKASRHWLHTMLFVSYFPQLVAGPILKAHEFLPQIRQKFFGTINWERCFRPLILGYFLKMVIADNLKDYTYWIEYPYFLEFHSLHLLGMLFGYSMQIFADFAGYSLIAIGIGRLFGYELMTNFNFPYISRSFSEFWRRWHISLSSWLRDYLYVPLGGNRKGRVRTYLNLFLVMFLGGLWHGAAWSYAVWGTTHGLFLAVERALRKKTAAQRQKDRAAERQSGRATERQKDRATDGQSDRRAERQKDRAADGQSDRRTERQIFGPRTNQPADQKTVSAFSFHPSSILKAAFVFAVVTWAWLLFKLPQFGLAVEYMRAIGTNFDRGLRIPDMWYIAYFSTPVILYHAAYVLRQGMFKPLVEKLMPLGYGAMIFALLLDRGTPGAFIYFQF